MHLPTIDPRMSMNATITTIDPFFLAELLINRYFCKEINNYL
jgi:hypothetical protein